MKSSDAWELKLGSSEASLRGPWPNLLSAKWIGPMTTLPTRRADILYASIAWFGVGFRTAQEVDLYYHIARGLLTTQITIFQISFSLPLSIASVTPIKC